MRQGLLHICCLPRYDPGDMRVRLTLPGKKAPENERGVYRVMLAPDAPDDFPFRITFDYMYGENTLHCVGLHLAPDVEELQDLEGTTSGAADLTPPTVRDLADRFRDLESIARAHLGAAPGVEHVSRARRRRELSDGFLLRVAHEYRLHQAMGASPVQAIARSNGVSRRTAANWVSKSRAAGHFAALDARLAAMETPDVDALLAASADRQSEEDG
jgi:hypothetical protein